ncbi:MAG: glycosyl hydrolase family 8 [Paludibacteraceae bacterium]|nr:glycosyl hydrolase family 8 [Paludibacteraceae bacterium]
MRFHNRKGLAASLALMGLSMLPTVQVMAQDHAYDPSVFVKTDINSGNPAFPFPQFLEYKGGGKSLAKYNAEGVTHADMEKAMREAYVMMTHRCRYANDTVSGVRYMTYNKDVPHNYGVFVSEGDGYALLAAAMFADQPTFNGLYMWIHDNRFSGVKRFKDGKVLRAEDRYFTGPYIAGWNCDETSTSSNSSHSATDGDNDIAMAMLIAYKQWGEWMMQDGKKVLDSEGNPISLKYEAQRVVGALVDTIANYDSGSGLNSGYLSGIIGIDGYTKCGNSWGELTHWRLTEEGEAAYPGLNGPFGGGPNLLCIYGHTYIDYDAPAYYTEFAKWLEGDGEGTNWQINQFKRAAASANWLNQKAYEAGHQASIGLVTMETDGEPKFDVYIDGEDFRYPWRHMMDYLWHGDADYDWDPKTHQVIEGTNNSEYLMAIRHAELLKNPSNDGEIICSKLGLSPDPGQPKWFGVSQIPQQWNLDGSIRSAYHTNYSVGAGSPAAVISGDEELLSDIYRQCEIKWDGTSTDVGFDDEERYEGSTPKYFHDWFRTLGMLICSGNMAAPSAMEASANVKVYMSTDKTYAYPGDKITYGVSYRNYGSVDAKDAVITTKLAPVYTFVSAKGDGKYDAASHTITWNIGSIPGFKTGRLAESMGSVEFTVTANDVEKNGIKLCSSISGTNFDEWVSNEYPNNATYTMERNVVDIIDNPLVFQKKANVEEVAINDTIEYTLNLKNLGINLNGGRSEVNFTTGQYETDFVDYSYYRVFNDASEAYINLNNYRISYFIFDTTYTILNEDCPRKFAVDNTNDLKKWGFKDNSFTVKNELIVQGKNEDGKWNQKLTIGFDSMLMAPSSHLYDHLNGPYQIHKGVSGPFYVRTRLGKMTSSMEWPIVAENSDWSHDNSVKIKSIGGEYEIYTLIGPKWDYDGNAFNVDNYTRNVCSDDVEKNFSRVLVEEWDGYTWRRIAGMGPGGMAFENVVIVDSIPEELELIDVSGMRDYKYEVKDGKLYIEVPALYTGQTENFKYKCRVKANNANGEIVTNATLASNTANAVTDNVSVKFTETKIEKVNTDVNGLVDVYNANGVLLKKQTSSNKALNGLPYGVYIVNGEKMVKNQK